MAATGQQATVTKSKERLEVLARIEQYEKEGRFSEDVEIDPPGRELKPDEIDYIPKPWRFDVKIKTGMTYHLARKFMNKMIDEKQLIVKEIIGIEHYKNLQSGAVITCNHFNALDSFIAQIVYEAAEQKNRKFYRVINESNYTSFPGFFGMLMRNCNTLPLSSNRQTMKKFMRAVDTLLRAGHFVLMYPEGSMWWNYRKPKPFKRGAYTLAVRSNVPVLPIFVTMQDSDHLDGDGFPVQEHTIHVGKPIYPDMELDRHQRADDMLEKNYALCKEIYEKEYKVPLTYTTVPQE